MATIALAVLLLLIGIAQADNTETAVFVARVADRIKNGARVRIRMHDSAGDLIVYSDAGLATHELHDGATILKIQTEEDSPETAFTCYEHKLVLAEQKRHRLPTDASTGACTLHVPEKGPIMLEYHVSPSTGVRNARVDVLANHGDKAWGTEAGMQLLPSGVEFILADGFKLTATTTEPGTMPTEEL